MDDKKSNENSPKTGETAKPRTRRTRKTASASQAKSTTRKTAAKSEEQASEEKIPTNLAESVAYLKAIGLRRVSNKTFINETDLAAFLEEDFSNINKTKALGFIQILEREYPVQLQELRQSYLHYYQQHKREQEEKTELFPHAKNDPDIAWRKYLVWLAAALVAGGLIWYLVAGRDDDLSTLESDEHAVAHDLNSDVVEEAAKKLGALDANKSVQAEATQPPEQKAQEPAKPQSARAVPFTRGASQNTTAATPLESAVSKPKHAPNASLNATDTPSDDLDLDAMVKEMVQEYNLTDETMDTEANRSTAVAANEKAAPQSKVTPAAEPKKAQAVAKTTNTSRANATKAQKTQKRKAIHNSKLYIIPRQKSWVGVIYLDDYTKKDFLIRKRLNLDPKRPQLIVVGHNKFEIFNNGYSYRFRGRGPVRFIYKDGEIMEITNREFRKYSKGVAW